LLNIDVIAGALLI